ncbi:rhodanese-like domain-containing protein [Desulfogranum japonicum]|uniref:rhodanese-like domain-containing protein n=1 Tax=Desulfogranum japonicum TaxID=231447 RepID=UPI000403B386|nr:rhodanese-like domain-containing protein [Desulfogranum japonicum]
MAVAIKALGFSNIRIYNGGIKDWKKNDFPLESEAPLPETEVSFIEAKALYALLKEFQHRDCRDINGDPLLTLLDLRNDNILQKDTPPPVIKTTCKVTTYLLDDLLDEKTRDNLPRKGMMVVVTETGNRDEFAIRYLSQYGFTAIKGLKFGMRGWIKQRYPTR